MKRISRILALLLAIVMIAALFAGCGDTTEEKAEETVPAAEPAEAPAEDTAEETAEEAAKPMDRALRVGTLQAANTFDPLNSELDIAMDLVYDTILKRDPDTFEVAPNIASAWNWDDDTTLRLTIRDDVYFSNGEKLTPEDVLFTLWRTVNVNDQYTASMSYSDINWDESTVDGQDVIVKYDCINAVALDDLTRRFAAVLCKSYVESIDEESFWDAPVGTGAYTLVENVDGSHSSYIRNEDYWDELPEAKEITITYYGEASTMYIDLETGAIDMAINLASNDADRLVNGEAEGVEYLMVPTYDMIFVGLPEYVEAYEDIRVRQAIAYGLDVPAITKALFGNLAEPATSTLIAGLPYHEDLGYYEYDPEQAKELLAEAGYSEGELTFRLIAPQTPVNQKLGEILQAYMADIGINISVEIYEFPVAIPMLMNNECEFGANALNGTMADAADIYSQHAITCTNGVTASSDEMLNGLIEQGLSTRDEQTRQEVYSEIQQWDYDNCRWIPLCYPTGCIGYSNQIDQLPAYNYLAPYLRFVTFK